MSNSKWARKVGSVFITRPRIGGKHTVWLDRKDAERRFTEAIQHPGAHVCLDGPTGVGKTSLVLTELVAQSVRHIAVMTTASMTWVEFCRRLVGKPTNEEVALSGEAELGVDKGLPIAKLRVSLGEKGKPIDDVELADKLATTWTEHDVAARLAEKDLVLVVDDLERASDELLRRISDLCKLLTQAYVSENAKIIVVGSGDIYNRLHRHNAALDERLLQVSLGAFKRQSDSRVFMTRGLDRLRLRHPWNSVLAKEFEQRHNCSVAIWEAADGLPKSLNRLGYEIAMRAEGRPGPSAHDILEISQRVTEEHWIQYNHEFPELLSYLEGDPTATAVVKCLYEEGIGRIHRVPEIMRRLFTGGIKDVVAIERALDALVNSEFLVRTGSSGELLFALRPTAAHTLGVYVRDPIRFSHLALPRRPSQAIQLAFPLPLDRGVDDDDTPSTDA